MTQAKHMYGKGKTDATRDSFRRKLEHMDGVLKTWKKQGYRDDQFWPASLRALAEWNEPERQIFSWSSANVTNKSNKKYATLTERYWRLQTKAEPHLVDAPQDTRQKRIIVKLGEENARLLWEVMQLRSALKRVAPNSDILKTTSFL